MANPKGINQYTKGHNTLHSAIRKGVKGINASMTIDAYRSVAAKALINNRKVFAQVGIKGPAKTELLYKTATAAVQVSKARYATFAKTLASVHRNK